MKLKKTPNYSKKILSLKKLKKIFDKKRKQKIILCHGNFDVVHLDT